MPALKIYIKQRLQFTIIFKKKAVAEKKQMNEEAGNIAINLTVSDDETWKKRGFSSLLGVSTLVGKYSKKVLEKKK